MITELKQLFVTEAYLMDTLKKPRIVLDGEGSQIRKSQGAAAICLIDKLTVNITIID